MTIVSGGQTGADRAALDWAIAHEVPHGGWCPHGRLAEDGPIDPRYGLRETPLPDYVQRTEWNVRDADATVVFSLSRELSGGSRLTLELARSQDKPCLHLSQAMHGEDAASILRAFLIRHRVRVLNVAGPRGSVEPDVGLFVRRTLGAVFESGEPS